MTLAEAQLYDIKIAATNYAMWPCGGFNSYSGHHRRLAVSSDVPLADLCSGQAPRTGASYATFVGINSGFTLLAALLVFFAPRAGGSGLPALKAYLNGVRVPGLLRVRTLIAKVIGVTFVVSTGLPMGREGPMVHAGAMVSAILSRLRFGPMRPLLALGLPSTQRTWVGMGAAAGVAAAFNAPLGGILYAFEEVCSHWNANLTWRSFFCVVIAAVTFNLIIKPTRDGGNDASLLLARGFVIGLDDISTDYSNEDLGWFTVVGIAGGFMGAMYNRVVFLLKRVHRRMLRNRVPLVFEAFFIAWIASTIYFWVPLAFSCRPCNATASDGGEISDCTSLAAAHGPNTLLYVRHECEYGYFSPLATLFMSPQEGIIKRLLSRSETSSDDVSVAELGTFLAIYFVIATVVIGLAVPAGNFIPAFTMGAGLGRLLSHAAGATTEIERGRFALMGSAAALCGVTRMTLTLAAILVEVTNDVGAMLPLMYTIALAKVTADLFAASFDDGMMREMNLPYIEYDPPSEFSFLTAKDVMSRGVIVLREVERVGDLLAVLRRTTHSGFPVVDIGPQKDKTFFSGLILRRHLYTLLQHRVWELQANGDPLPIEAERDFVGSARNFPRTKAMVNTMELSLTEKLQTLDLRPFMDPCPYLANELMPLRRIHRMFAELGLRHLPVVDCREQVIGIITRKDMLSEIIEERALKKDLESKGDSFDGKHSHTGLHLPSCSMFRTPRSSLQPVVEQTSGSLRSDVESRRSVDSGSAGSVVGNINTEWEVEPNPRGRRSNIAVSFRPLSINRRRTEESVTLESRARINSRSDGDTWNVWQARREP